MLMNNKNVISITNRKLCNNDFLTQLEKISKSGVESIYLREKDLSSNDYKVLAEKCLNICSRNNVKLFIVQYIDLAKNLKCDNLHLSYKDFVSNYEILKDFKNISVSVHNIGEAVKSQELGATRLITGHIFATDCKKGVAPRGLIYLKTICTSVNIPVYAIGGITPDNVDRTIRCGATGVCIMSSLMQTDNPNLLIENLMK